MRSKVYTTTGNVYDFEGSVDNIRKKIQWNGVNGMYVIGMAMRNLQTKSHKTIIPFSSIESIMEFGDDE